MKRKTIRNLLIFSTAIASMHAFNYYLFKRTKKLDKVLSGDSDYYFSQYGRIYYNKRGTGEPLLLLHGISTGASSFIWRKNFYNLSREFTVYALDLPGFGKSQKLPITYRAHMFQSVIETFIKDVIGEPVHVISNGLSSAYTMKLEYNNPGMYKKIISICPTGIYEMSLHPGKLGKTLTKTIKLPVIGTFLYNLLVSKPGIIYFNKNQAYYNRGLISHYVLNHYVNSSRQDGVYSKYAPASLLGGYLNQNIIEEYEGLRAPMLIIWGKNSKTNNVDNLRSFIDLNPAIQYHVFENCGSYPQEEYPVEFNQLCTEFLKK